VPQPKPRDVLLAAFARIKRAPIPIQAVLQTIAKGAPCPPG
jgi:hypothetical protein